MWIYSSGFPKSQDIGRSIQRSLGVEKTIDRPDLKETGRGLDNFSHNMDGGSSKESGKQVVVTDPEAKRWEGWGTALKPAHEPIALARKPIKLSIAKNVQKYGVGALNIDATRIPATDLKEGTMGTTAHDNYNAEKNADEGLREGEQLPWIPSEQGRFPSNVMGEIAEPYQKYFYCPKVGRRERHIGFDLDIIPTNPEGIWNVDGTGVQYNAQKNKQNGNNHPTVKPVALMEYLIKLITPPGGTVLDPFNGSGSTGCAAVELGHPYIGCELDPAYIEISCKRIEAWTAGSNNFDQLFDQE